MNRPLAFRFTTPPGNNEFVIPFDTTRHCHALSTASLAAGSAFLAPGPYRGLFAGVIWRLSVLCTGQNVTLDPQILVGNAGTAADWATQAATGIPATITAGTAGVYEFKPLAPDSRILVTAGATGPTTLIVQLDVIQNSTYGG